MSRKYKILDPHQPYFVTCTVIKWLKIFNQNSHINILLSSLLYCQDHKGLLIYGWCFMPNHVHMIVGSQKDPLSNVLRDFKSYTSRQIRKVMSTKLYDPEISFIYQQMIQAGTNNSNNKDWQLWQQHNQPKVLFSRKVARQKLDYIHFNPVKAGLTKTPQSWPYSSAIDYSGGSGLLKITYLQ